MVRVVFVCLGNICRSPTAEGIFRDIVRKEGLHKKIHIESRGTGPWHVGEPPDQRAQECALEFDVDISDLRGSQFSPYDFDQFDHILVMDESNYRDVIRQARDENDKAKVDYLLSYSQNISKNVPDPYHGGSEGFRKVFSMIEEACQAFLEEIKRSL